ncbi:MAG: ROK family protein, partial [Pseudoflavonifractor sp.]
AAVYRDLGIYLGHAVGLYAMFYELNDVLVMGGVAGGAGGAHILAEAQRVLREDYPEVKAPLRTADSTVCQVGQSVAAASLPETV